LVLLDDTERSAGADSDSARILADEIQRRLRGDRPPAERKAVARATR
jgi:hypothetical protein